MADDERIDGFLPPRPGGSPPVPAPFTSPAAGPERAAAPTAPRRAAVALVCAILGLLLVPPVFSTAAVLLGRRARRELEAAGVQRGLANARAAVLLGWVGLAFFGVLVVLIGSGVVELEGLQLREG